MSDEYIDKLIQGFEAGTLTVDEWDHRAHLIMCLYYLYHLPYYEAVLKIKLGIIHSNKAIGIKESLDRGYHETLTHFWIWAIDAFCQQYKTNRTSLSRLVQSLLDSPYGKKYLPFFFYTEDLLFSNKARVTWVNPDRHPLSAHLITESYPESIWYG